MPKKLSRRSIARYMADTLASGKGRQKVIRQLAGYLVESRRTNELELIVRDVDYNLSLKGITSATITSAFDLTVETKKAITQFIAHHTKSTQISLESLIDPAVIGGVKISLPGRELDQTIAHQLTVLKTRFKKA